MNKENLNVLDFSESDKNFISALAPSVSADMLVTYHLLQLIQDKFDKHFSKWLNQFGLDMNMYSVIVALFRSEKDKEYHGLKPSEISNYVVLPRNTISTTLLKLEKNGLIYREDDVIDRRSFRIFLSEKGRKLLEDNILTIFEKNQEVFSCLNKEEVELLFKILKTVYQHEYDLGW